MIDRTFLDSFRTSLYNGDYNLLLGSGITLGSQDGHGKPMPSAGQLREHICKIVDAREGSSLAYASRSLSATQIKTEFTERFKGCSPDSRLSHICKYLWKRLYTFNIDDILEGVYRDNSQQKIDAVTWKNSFIPDTQPGASLAIHLHGYTGIPDDGYVFSYTDYAKITSSPNSWMLVLSQTIATDPFIIAGTSLSEPDLEHYLSYRTNQTQRRDTGPSILIDPFPDGPMRDQCKRLGVILIENTFQNFLAWLNREFPNPPAIDQVFLHEPFKRFEHEPSSVTKARFFKDFQPIRAWDIDGPARPPLYTFGGEPSWEDIHSKQDIRRPVSQILEEQVLNVFSGKNDDPYTILLNGQAGQGKSTILKRVAHNLAEHGHMVFYHSSLGKIDTKSAIECFTEVNGDIILVVDSYADHVDQIEEILDSIFEKKNIAVFATDRHYRMPYVSTIAGDVQTKVYNIPAWSIAELSQLAYKYQKYGIISGSYSRKSIPQIAKSLETSNVSIAVCQLLNDIKPIEEIADSLLLASDQNKIRPFLVTALAAFCYGEGIRQSILQSICSRSFDINELTSDRTPLRLVRNNFDRQFLLPVHRLLGQAVLKSSLVSVESRFDIFHALGTALAPHVNRNAIYARTPEWRLSSRLLDYDDVVVQFLGDRADELYDKVTESWKWNSRFWEQRALCVLGDDVDLALRYANTAVSIEDHALPKTTLAKILINKARIDETKAEKHFIEAIKQLDEAITFESSRRIAIHPYTTLISGTNWYIERYGIVPSDVKTLILERINQARKKFPELKKLLNDFDMVNGN